MTNNVNRVTEALMTNIVRGQYTDGLPSQEVLALEFNVSRTVLREAVSRLEYNGILVVQPKIGTRVRPIEQWQLMNTELLSYVFDRQDIAHRVVYEALIAWLYIGPVAASLAAGHGKLPVALTVPHVAQASAHTADSLVEPLLDFHRTIFSATNNMFVSTFVGVVDLVIQKLVPLLDSEDRLNLLDCHLVLSLLLSSQSEPLTMNDLKSVYTDIVHILRRAMTDTAFPMSTPTPVSTPAELHHDC